MTQPIDTKSPLSPIELTRLFDSLDEEGKEVLTGQMLMLNYLTTKLQQLHVEILERIDKGEKIKPEDFGGLCVSFSDEREGETWSQGVGAAEPMGNAFIGAVHAAWKEFPEEIFETMIALAKDASEVDERQEKKKEEEKKEEEPAVIDLEKWKVDNQWKN